MPVKLLYLPVSSEDVVYCPTNYSGAVGTLIGTIYRRVCNQGVK